MSNLIDRLALYITRLPAEHPASVAFGKRLCHTASLPVPVVAPGDPVPPPPLESDPANNIYLFAFPVDMSKQVGADYAPTGVDSDIYASNSPGLCIRPEAGGAPDPALGAVYPYFTIVCRHESRGRAFNCMQALIHELTNNSRAIRQNGVILPIHSQPALIFGDRRGIYAYAASFRCMVAEPIH